MAPWKRAPSGGEEQREDWLRRGQPARRRPWALREQLFQTGREQADEKPLLAAQLAREQAELSRIEGELRAQAMKIARLELRLNAPATPDRRHLPPDTEVSAADRTERRPTIDPHPLRAVQEHNYWLTRCEGFRVDSPLGRVGVVEGLRFGSRVDQPDLLEVRAGLFGRSPLLIPVEAIDHIFSDQQRIVLDDDLHLHSKHSRELRVRLRTRLSLVHRQTVSSSPETLPR